MISSRARSSRNSCVSGNKCEIKKLDILLTKSLLMKNEDSTEAILKTIHSEDKDVNWTDDSGKDEN